MQHVDVFEMLKDQLCNKLKCTITTSGGALVAAKLVKTCAEIRQMAERVDCDGDALYKGGTLQLEWEYPLKRIVVMTCSLADSTLNMMQTELRNVQVALRQFKVEYEEFTLEELALNASDLRKPLEFIRQHSAVA